MHKPNFACRTSVRKDSTIDGNENTILAKKTKTADMIYSLGRKYISSKGTLAKIKFLNGLSGLPSQGVRPWIHFTQS